MYRNTSAGTDWLESTCSNTLTAALLIVISGDRSSATTGSSNLESGSISPIATTAACRTDSTESSSACVNWITTPSVAVGFTRPMASTDASRTIAVGSCMRGKMEFAVCGSPILPRASAAVRRISGPSSRSNSSKSETVRSLDEGGESWTQPARQRTDRTTEHPMVGKNVQQRRREVSGKLMKTVPQFTLVSEALRVRQAILWPHQWIAGIPSGQNPTRLGWSASQDRPNCGHRQRPA